MPMSSMRTKIASGHRGLAAAGALALLVTVGGCDDGGTEASDGAVDPTCTRDDSEGASTAVDLVSATPATGYICPIEDTDWYRIRLDNGESLLRVDLGMTTVRSPIEVTYSIWATDASGEPSASVGGPDPANVGHALSDVHRLDPGDYLVVVRDQGDNLQDYRNTYSITLTTSAELDRSEPNNDATTATPATSEVELEGYISYAGDQDWFSIAIATDRALHVSLDMELATLEPWVRVFDSAGNLIIDEDNPAGRTEATDIDLSRLPPSAGTYYVVVSDDDDSDADPEVPYTLLIETLTDLDENEANDHPSTATPIPGTPVSCGASWSSWHEESGTIGAPGDVDFFQITAAGCARPIVEAELEFETAGLSESDVWELQRRLQASVALVRERAGAGCGDDEDCSVLPMTCSDQWDCAGYLQNCLPDGFCGGATLCLPGGTCGAYQIVRSYQASTATSGTPPPNRAVISAPVLSAGSMYLRVSDYHSDAGDPTVPYTLRVRVRDDPDTHEPNNLYAYQVLDIRDLPIGENISAEPGAVTIPGVAIHDCTAGADCCSPTPDGSWTTGYLSYDYDMDFYALPHPCPDEDCMLRMRYQADSGGVTTLRMDFLPAGSSSENAFFAWEIDQGTAATVFGGTTAGDECFYGSLTHEGSYYVLVRDEWTPNREWDSEHGYRFCVEKTALGCVEPPCSRRFIAEGGGCDLPAS